jgi:hypothetical protein
MALGKPKSLYFGVLKQYVSSMPGLKLLWNDNIAVLLGQISGIGQGPQTKSSRVEPRKKPGICTGNKF